MTSPTARSLVQLRKDGYIAQVVERWNSFANIRQDLFGFIDIVAIHPEQKGVLAIQATSNSGGNVSAHHKKIIAEPRSRLWLKCGNRILLWGWSKKGARGKRKLWTLTSIDITLDS